MISRSSHKKRGQVVLVQTSRLSLRNSRLVHGQAMSLGLEIKTGAFKRTIRELLQQGLIEYTFPDKPTSRLQKYRLTEKGNTYLASTGNSHD